ncbi:MAG: hypothetical protein LLG08_05820 [Actinomycetia bacterium]|nr:hypothetical protein [Actinomycetes bacterium]
MPELDVDGDPAVRRHPIGCPKSLRIRPAGVSFGTQGLESGERVLAGDTHRPVPGWRFLSG